MKSSRRARTLAICLGLAIVPAWAGAEVVLPLPAPQQTGGLPLMEALARRQTRRDIGPDAVPDSILSSLLWAANGVNRPATGHRTTPSARNWKGIDVYVARADGLYLYRPDQHQLRQTLAADVRSAAGQQPFVQQAPVVLIYVADHRRMPDADPEAVAFYAATDTGFISQNVYLFCAANDLATVAVGWVDKPALAQTMQLEAGQHVVLTQPVGHPLRAAAEPPPAPARAAAWRDGTYRGRTPGYVAEIAVDVTVADGKIADVAIAEHRESRPLAALESMPRAIVAAQDVDGVDAVTGATLTSRGVREAARQALQQAQ